MGKKYNEFTEDDKNKMLELHNDGLFNREIAEMFNTSTTMIARLLRSMNVVSRHPRLTEKRKIDIKECYERYKNVSIVSEKMKCSPSTVIEILKEFNIHKIPANEVRRKYNVEDAYFENIDTQNKAYALGLIFSDGTISKNGNYIVISLQARDKSVLDALNHEYGGDRKLFLIKHSEKNPNWQDQYMLSVASQKMKNDLINLGAVPNKSLILEFPNNIPHDLIRHFVRGYFDGDGHLSKNEDRCSIISTKNFCEELAHIIHDELNVHTSIILCHHDENKPTRSLQIAGRNQVKKFLDWIYKDSDIRLERKYLLYLSKYK